MKDIGLDSIQDQVDNVITIQNAEDLRDLVYKVYLLALTDILQEDEIDIEEMEEQSEAFVSELDFEFDESLIDKVDGMIALIDDYDDEEDDMI